MESEKILEHDTTLEHALDIARANLKEAQRLLDEAKAAHAAGDISEDRVLQLEALLELAAEDLRRVTKEQ
ncbi:TolC family protein [Arthrobacter bambusae]|uniref:TolC family protein n=1 Tax=Arthrobacter bambusae TaxID=1338426 RepID=UPI00278A21B2|nr:TolC family protein [Arthrobacter bambusae]MDQ0030537.1 outer membrane protein TolC [Arthrobacter bambusae]MDQ0098454.1 outer membrane protein TolC [Arthrobacter bambusae]